MKVLELVLPLPPSVNACYVNRSVYGKRGRQLTEVAKNWKLVTGYEAKAEVRRKEWSMPASEEKIVIELVAYWPDLRRHDMNNLHKLLCDALEGVVYLDDCKVLARDMDYFLDRKHPRVECRIYLKAEAEHEI